MQTGLSYIHKPSKKASRITVRLNDEGEVIVTTPYGFSLSRLPSVVEEARDWIERQRAKLDLKPRLLTSVSVYFFGNEYQVKIHKTFDGSVSFKEPIVHVSPLELTASSVIALLEKWLKAQATQYIVARTYALSEIMKLQFKGIALKQQQTRWGSCSSQKNLNFNWKLIHAPKEVIDYVIIHELAHTKHMNHGRSFWDLVSQYDPDHPHHRRWLEKYGSVD